MSRRRSNYPPRHGRRRKGPRRGAAPPHPRSEPTTRRLPVDPPYAGPVLPRPSLRPFCPPLVFVVMVYAAITLVAWFVGGRLGSFLAANGPWSVDKLIGFFGGIIVGLLIGAGALVFANIIVPWYDKRKEHK